MKFIRDGKLTRERRFVIGFPEGGRYWSAEYDRHGLGEFTPMTIVQALGTKCGLRARYQPMGYIADRGLLVFELVPRLDLGMSDGRGGIAKVKQ